MALPSAFRERLEQMEQTRNQRISLLRAERDLQTTKSQILLTKFSSVRFMEQRCLKLEQKIASQQFISSLKSEIDALDSKYDHNLQQIRILGTEVQEMVELEKEMFYSFRRHEMEDFCAQVENFIFDCRMQVQELRNKVNEFKLSFLELQGENGYLNGSDEIVEEEKRKIELLTKKEKLDRSLSSNYQIRGQLQKQFHSILLEKKKKGKAIPVGVNK